MSGLGSRLREVALLAFLVGAIATPTRSQNLATQAFPVLVLPTEALSDGMYLSRRQYLFVLLSLSNNPGIERDALMYWGFEPEEHFIDFSSDEFETDADLQRLLLDRQAVGLEIFYLDELSDELRQLSALRRFKAIYVEDSPEVAPLLPKFITNNPLLFVQLDESAHSENLLDACAHSETLRALHVELPANDVAITQGFSSLERLWVSQSESLESCRIENLPKLEYVSTGFHGEGELLSIRNLPCLQRLDEDAWVDARKVRLENLPSLSYVPNSLLHCQLLILQDLPTIRTLNVEITDESSLDSDLIGVSLCNLPALEELTVNCWPHGRGRVMAQLRELPKLKRLEWRGVPPTTGLVEYLDSQGAAASLRAGTPPSVLNDLSFESTTLTSEILAACGRLPALDKLTLNHCTYDSAALFGLGAAGRPPRELQIYWDAYYEHYAAVADLRLESLVLIPSDSLTSIGANDRLTAVDHPLTAAELTIWGAGWETERLLLRSTRLRSLAIDLSEYDECFFAVLPELPQLERLSTTYDEADDEAFCAGLQGCSSLCELELREVSVSAGVLQTIQQMPRLSSLTLTDCPNLLQIAPSLAECKQLEVLSLCQARERPEDPISPELLQMQSELRQRLPNVQVEVH